MQLHASVAPSPCACGSTLALGALRPWPMPPPAPLAGAPPGPRSCAHHESALIHTCDSAVTQQPCSLRLFGAHLVHAAACATLAAKWRLLRGKMHGGKQQLRIGCGQSSRDSKGPFLRSPFWRGLFFPLVNGTQPKDLAVRHGEPRGSAWCVRRPRRQLQPGKRPPADSHGTGMPRISAKIVEPAPSMPKFSPPAGWNSELGLSAKRSRDRTRSK